MYSCIYDLTTHFLKKMLQHYLINVGFGRVSDKWAVVRSNGRRFDFRNDSLRKGESASDFGKSLNGDKMVSLECQSQR